MDFLLYMFNLILQSANNNYIQEMERKVEKRALTVGKTKDKDTLSRR